MTRPVGAECDRSTDCITGHCSFLAKGGPKCELPKLYNTCNPGYCPTGSTCITGICYPIEEKKEEVVCSPIQYKEDGKCYYRKSNGLSCVNSYECLGGATCYRGICTEMCYSDNKCGIGEICHLGQCVKGKRKVEYIYKKPTKTKSQNPKSQDPTTYQPIQPKDYGPSTMLMLIGLLGLLFFLVLFIWACFQCCCKSSKNQGKVVQQPAPSIYPSMESPNVPSYPPPPYMPSFPQPSSPPQYNSQPPEYCEEM